MRLNLREIINIPGGMVSFDYEPEVEDLSFDGIEAFTSPIHASGTIRNKAGVLQLEGTITSGLRCSCARCLKEFERSYNLNCSAVITDQLQDEDGADVYLLDGDEVDVDDIIISSYVLNMDQRFLCQEDCKGLCSSCGKNLNDGPCDCKKDIDPRLAVLGQLLEND